MVCPGVAFGSSHVKVQDGVHGDERESACMCVCARVCVHGVGATRKASWRRKGVLTSSEREAQPLWTRGGGLK